MHADPLLLLAGLGWVLGFTAMRFWSDWGYPAALVWIAVNVEVELEERIDTPDGRRLALGAGAGLAAFLACSANVQGRWQAPQQSLAILAAPEARDALPDASGILYTDDLSLFFQLFYRMPQAPFRYIVGYEAALMPPDDLATFRRIIVARTSENFAPWVAKMRPADRLIVRSAEGVPPIAGLEWTPVGRQIWSGRASGGQR